MIDIKLLRDNPAEVRAKLGRKKVAPEVVDDLIKLDEKRRKLHAEQERLQAELARLSKEVGRQFGQPKVDLIKQASEVSEQLSRIKPEVEAVDAEYGVLILTIPNPPLDDVPDGPDESANQVVKKVGKPREFDFTPKDHLELGEALGVIDSARGVKIAESRFVILRNQLVLLQFGLLRWAMEKLASKGFSLARTPDLVNRRTVQGTGYLPVGEDEVYALKDDNLYLVGTAEQALVGMRQEEILNISELPLRYGGYSSAFRREAGSYGKDMKGILRLHEFDKLEMVSFTTSAQSVKELEFIISVEEEIMAELGLPFQLVKMCAGDLGMQAATKFDIEAWMPGQNKYRETHSASNTTDFQTRRLNIRVKGKSGKLELAHSLNGTAIAIGRTLIAIMENYQEADGSITIPEVLRPYAGFDKISNVVKWWQYD